MIAEAAVNTCVVHAVRCGELLPHFKCSIGENLHTTLAEDSASFVTTRRMDTCMVSETHSVAVKFSVHGEAFRLKSVKVAGV